jgi:uncharacterized protein
MDLPGHEACRVIERSLIGTAVLAHQKQPCSLTYVIKCNAKWETEFAKVSGWVGDALIDVTINVDSDRHWRLNGTEVADVAGCIDVDLNFSPSTNLLPIRRLQLAVGAEAEVRAAWLRFPSFRLEPLEQRYQRLDETRYRYESAGGSFVADLVVNEAGLATKYGDLWVAE